MSVDRFVPFLKHERIAKLSKEALKYKSESIEIFIATHLPTGALLHNFWITSFLITKVPFSGLPWSFWQRFLLCS